MSVTISGDDRLAALFARVERIGDPAFQDQIVAVEAARSFAEIVEATPKKWFGQVRAAWQIEKPREGMRRLVNRSKIMFWLEEGTKDHGPKTAKALFIPLTRRAVDANKLGRAKGGSFGKRTITFEQARISKGVVKVRKVKLKYGVDYVLAKKVKGIKAMKIAAKQSVKSRRRLKRSVVGAINNLLR